MGIRDIYQIMNVVKEDTTLEKLVCEDGYMQGRRGGEPGGHGRLVFGIDTNGVMDWCESLVDGDMDDVQRLRMFFRELVAFTTHDIEVVCAFDGNRRLSWYEPCVALVRQMGYSVHKAPNEAEAELAALNMRGYIDVVVSPDPDVFMLGACKVLQRSPSDHRKLRLYRCELLLERLGIGQAGLVLYSLLMGYGPTQGVEGFDRSTSLEVAQSFGGCLLDGFQQSLSFDDLRVHRATWIQQVRNELQTNSQGRFDKENPTLSQQLTGNAFASVNCILRLSRPVTSFSPGNSLNIDSWMAGQSALSIPGLAFVLKEHLGWHTPDELYAVFSRYIWEGIFRQMLHSDDIDSYPQIGLLCTDEHSIKIVHVEESNLMSPPPWAPRLRLYPIDSWLRVTLSTEPLVEELDSAIIDLFGGVPGPIIDDHGLDTTSSDARIMNVYVPEIYGEYTLAPFYSA